MGISRDEGTKLKGIWIEGRLLNYCGFVGQQRGKHQQKRAKYWSLLSLHCGAIVMHSYHSNSLTGVYGNDHWFFFPSFFTLLLKWQENACLNHLCTFFTQGPLPLFFSSWWLDMRMRPCHWSISVYPCSTVVALHCCIFAFEVALSCWFSTHKSCCRAPVRSRLGLTVSGKTTMHLLLFSVSVGELQLLV